MANRNNVPFNVLPTDSNTAILAKDLTVGDLTPGKLGFFDAETGVSFDNTSTTIPKSFFLALGKPEGDFRMSAGQNIQKKGVLGFQRKNYTAGSPMSVTVSGFKPKYDSEYGLRVEFRNSHVYRIQGHVQFSKAYVVTTPCEADCGATDECLDPNKLAIQLFNEINLDSDELLVATFVADQDLVAANIDGISANIDAGEEVTLAEVEALIAHNASESASLTVSLKLVPNTVTGGNFNVGLNLNYHKLLETVLIVSPLQSLNCAGTTLTSEPLVFAEGTGNNILQKEYHASAWNGAGPYAVSMTTKTAIGKIEYLAKKDVNYTQFTLEYDVKSHSGWGEYENPLTTIVAIPSGHTTTINSVNSMMEKLV